MATAIKKVAWITGGGTGIGYGGAKALGASGWRVVISGRRANVLDEALQGLKAFGVEVSAIALDISEAADVQEAAQAILKEHGRIDLLVNNAGLNVTKRSFADVTVDGWDQVINTNLNGLMYCIGAVLPAMRVQQDGCIINIASWAGKIVTKLTGPAYNATKHAVVALTHSLNMEEFRNGIRACALSPAEVATPIMKLRPVPPSDADMARMLQVEDLGHTIAFVANMPSHVCVNEILISPTWNRTFDGTVA